MKTSKLRSSFLTATLLVAAGLLGGCVTTTFEDAQRMNREKLLRLSPGMSKEQVLEIMGTRSTVLTGPLGEKAGEINNPYRTELYRSAGQVFELLLYYTDTKSADNAVTDDELTPLVLVDGKLDGWGWSYWNDLVRKFEIRVR